MFNFSRFFGVSARDVEPKPEMNHPITVLRVPSADNNVMMDVVVELQEDNLLEFDDYSITALLKAGINPKALHVATDRRIGSDAEIEAFNARVDANIERMFNSNNE